jgi:hypothetical protein
MTSTAPDTTPEELDAELNDPTSERAIWLSRGLLEGALAFIGQARDSRFSLHCGFYELTYAPILDALAQAAARGARVEVTYEAGHYQVRNERRVETKYGQMNAEAISPYQGKANLYFRERIHHIRLTHNKFMVLCENGSPIEVWTGSTNISPSGFLGQSNNGHVVRDETIARLYFDYFEQLARDERRVAFRQFNVDLTPDPPDALPDGTTVLFSPRRGTKLLDWYGVRMDRATQTVILTSAFGVTPRLAAHFQAASTFSMSSLISLKTALPSGLRYAPRRFSMNAMKYALCRSSVCSMIAVIASTSGTPASTAAVRM